jgi:hypothetical protein
MAGLTIEPKDTPEKTTMLELRVCTLCTFNKTIAIVNYE